VYAQKLRHFDVRPIKCIKGGNTFCSCLLPLDYAERHNWWRSLLAQNCYEKVQLIVTWTSLLSRTVRVCSKVPMVRAGPRRVRPGQANNWRPFKPIFFKYLFNIYLVGVGRIWFFFKFKNLFLYSTYGRYYTLFSDVLALPTGLRPGQLPGWLAI
jgi:hypothetical protein